MCEAKEWAVILFGVVLGFVLALMLLMDDAFGMPKREIRITPSTIRETPKTGVEIVPIKPIKAKTHKRGDK